jgi:mRNA-degrading endonuclease RelE of RelBE toxin-antitoxin system
MTYDISWSKKALKQLSKLDTETKKKIWRAIDKLRDENAQIKN